MGVARSAASAPPASIRIAGFWRTFLYHCVSEPCTGRRLSLSSSETNQTGIEMVRPDLLPVTLRLISLSLESRLFRASFRAGICTHLLQFASCYSDLREAISMEKRYFTSDLSTLS